MAKVIGKDESAVKRVTCQNCAAIVEYVKNDVQTYNGTDYSGGPDGHTWVDCPACLNKIILSSW